LTGLYRGAAHSYCKSHVQESIFYSDFSHDLAGYDAHLFVKGFSEDNYNIRIVLNTEEKYISFSKFLEYPISEDGWIVKRYFVTAIHRLL
jgi:hypothetical protein